MSRTKYPHIFREGKIGNVTIPNRLCMSPMGVGNYSEFFEDRLIDFYGARARGGIGLVFFENNYVSSIAEDPYPRFMPVPRFDDRRKISSTYSIVKRVRNYGAVAGVQLGAGQGRFADVVDPDHPPMGASAYPCFKDPSVICIPMTEEDIAKKVAAFKRAAAMALECGFQVLELHAHAGYLLEQFLSKDLNKRTDKYGGSAENRFRFAKEILDGIREVVGDQLAISIRLSVDQKSEAGDGITFEEPTDKLFAFNSPMGACPECEGFGKVIGIDEQMVIPNTALSVYDGAVVCWRGEKMSEWKDWFIRCNSERGFPIFKPYFELTQEEKDWLWHGCPSLPQMKSETLGGKDILGIRLGKGKAGNEHKQQQDAQGTYKAAAHAVHLPLQFYFRRDRTFRGRLYHRTRPEDKRSLLHRGKNGILCSRMI